jgi:hypothetical protein
MKTTTATAIEQQRLIDNDSTSSLFESSNEFLNDKESDLESILVKEFEQGLPSDIPVCF